MNYRQGDLLVENEKLRAQVAELNAKLGKRREAASAWTSDQREGAKGFVIVISLLVTLTGIGIGVGYLTGASYVASSVSFVLALLFLWVAIRAATGHWNWWHGAFSSDDE